MAISVPFHCALFFIAETNTKTNKNDNVVQVLHCFVFFLVLGSPALWLCPCHFSSRSLDPLDDYTV